MSLRRSRMALAAFAVAAGACDSEIAFTSRTRPELITTIAGHDHVKLFWEPLPGASGYRVRDLDTGEVTDTDYDLPVAFVPFRSETTQLRLEITARRGNAESDPSPEIVVLRQPDYLSPSPVWIATGFGLAFGSAITGAGDVDGDGFEEVLIGAPATSGGGGVFLFRGRGSGLEDMPAWVDTRLAIAGTSEEFGAAVAHSETHLDGQPAWIVGAPGGAGRAYVYRHAEGATFAAPVVHDAPAGFEYSDFGRTVVTAGNLDGTLPRRDEIAIAAPLAIGGGRVFLYWGESAGPAVSPAFPLVEVSMMNVPDADLGVAMAPAGNRETDSADDLLLGAPGANASRGGVAILSGRQDLFSAAQIAIPAFDIEGDHPGERFGSSVASIGDADQDDRDEYAVGAPMHDCENDPGDENDDSVESGRVVVVDPDGVVPFTDCGAPGQRLGTSLTFAGEVIEDREQLLVGALDARGQGFFRLDHVVFEPPAVENFPGDDGIAGEGFGRVLATSDVNGDGHPDVLVGIPDRGPRGTVLLYVTVPAFGPEIHAGPPIETLAGTTVHLDAAFVSDSADTDYQCSIDWGVAGEPAWVSAGPCTASILRAAAFAYPPPPPGDDFEDHTVRVTVDTRDGRSGLGLTRVRVRP